ncbi:MAG: class I SAM-dependent methyltransferase [Bacteroides sp.]|nr:class I SAM-dependent methyltransferase [Bacteroides sp.]
MNKEEIDFFNRLAPIWDAEEVLSIPEKINSILEKLNINKGYRIADLGTGTGVLVPYLSERVGKNGKVTAIDASPEMLRIAKQKFGETENVEFVQADFEEEPIKGSYDMVLLYSVYPHLHRPIATLRRLTEENLTSDGRIIIAFPTDEKFINSIHHDRKSDSDLLPAADVLTSRLKAHNLTAETIAYNEGEYIVEIRKK